MTAAATAIRPATPSSPLRRWLRLCEIGRMWPLVVRSAHIPGFGLARTRSLLYASDLHLGWPWTTPLAAELAELIQTLRPDITLLGGDLADRKAGVSALRDLVTKVRHVCPVYAVAGNHDARLGKSLVREAVRSSGGEWLDARATCSFDRPSGDSIELHGAIGRRAARSIFVAHDPAVFPAAARAGYPLVLAGHLHGGQCVLATSRQRLYPGAWCARWTGLSFTAGEATMLVSRGAGDTLPLRFNCPREVLLCTIR